MSLYPVFLDLRDARVVIVGGGPVAASKLDGLLAAGARVTVIAPEICEAIRSKGVALIEREFAATDLDGQLTSSIVASGGGSTAKPPSTPRQTPRIDQSEGLLAGPHEVIARERADDRGLVDQPTLAHGSNAADRDGAPDLDQGSSVATTMGRRGGERRIDRDRAISARGRAARDHNVVDQPIDVVRDGAPDLDQGSSVAATIDRHADEHRIERDRAANHRVSELAVGTIGARPRWVVAAATPEVNRDVAAAAAARGLFVNAVDDKASATAYLGGVVRRGEVTVAISTGGIAPALAGLLREALDALLPDDLERWIEVARDARASWKRTAVPMTERRPLLLRALDRIYGGPS